MSDADPTHVQATVADGPAPMALPEPQPGGPHPLKQLVISRMKEFYREPEALFWVYGFPLLMAVALGVAFRNRAQQIVVVDVQQGPGAEVVAQALGDPVGTTAATSPAKSQDAELSDVEFRVQVVSADEARRRLRAGKASLVVVPQVAAATDGSAGASTIDLQQVGLEYLFDPTRPEGIAARAAVDDRLLRAAGRTNPLHVSDREFSEPGSRYIDYLIPGLIGLNLMGGGLWGVGFVVVDMRVRHLLKRFITTPMKKWHFLLALMFSRFFFSLTEVALLLVFSYFAFGVHNAGSWAAIGLFVVLGDFAFAGLGLLVASRARTLETASGLMNLAMLPMWLLSGAFFSYERFPEETHALIRLLPLTALADGLRSVMIEGTSLAGLLPEIAVLVTWMVGCFAIALKLFRWS